MSSEHTFNPKTQFDRVSLHPLKTAASAVFADLTPFLSADSPIDETLAEQLRNVLKVFAKGVEFALLAVGYADGGILFIIKLLRKWEEQSPRTRCGELKAIAERLLFAESSSIDSLDAYVEARSNADLLFKQLLDTYGPDVVVEVTSVGKHTNNLNFEKTTTQSIGIRVTSHLAQSESSMTAFIDFLQKFNKAMRDFLGDERISLAQSYKDMPFLSIKPSRAWWGMHDQLVEVEVQLTGAVLGHMAWFKRPSETTVDLFMGDFKYRHSKIVMPDINVQVPETKVTPTELPQTWFPSDLVQTALVSDGDCVIHIANIEQSKPGTTTVKFNFVTRPTCSWILRLQNLAVYCIVRPNEDSPFQIVAHHPSNVQELRDDSYFQPKNCHPELNIATSSTASSSTIHWNFSRPRSDWARDTVLPTNLSIAIDVEHSVGILVEVWLIFTYRRLFIWKYTESVRSAIYARAKPTTASMEPARL